MNLRIKYNSKFILETITFQFILLYAMFARILEITEIGNKVMVVLLGLCIVKHLNQAERLLVTRWKNVAILIAIGLLMIANVLVIGQNGYLVSNVLIIAYSSIFALSINYLTTIMGDELTKLLDRNFWLINLFWVANLVVLFLQIQGTGFLIRSEWLAINPYYPDHCSGLFGNSGTHELAFFSTFWFIYNWTYAYGKKNSQTPKVILVYTVLTMGVMLLFSLKNDNKAFYALLFVIGGLYYLLAQLWRYGKWRRILGRLIAICICAGFAFIVLLRIPEFRQAIHKYASQVISILKVDYQVANGGNERLAIFKYALKHGGGWGLGSGLGLYSVVQNKAEVFNHFSINSMGAMTFLGGVWYYLGHCWLFGICFAQNINKPYKKIWMTLVGVVIYVGLSLYSNIFSTGVSMVWIAMMSVTLRNLFAENQKRRAARVIKKEN